MPTSMSFIYTAYSLLIVVISAMQVVYSTRFKVIDGGDSLVSIDFIKLDRMNW
jgi:hypothetical protein